MKKVVVKIYTTPTCQFCQMAKKYFDSNGVDYQEFNVLEDGDAREEMVKKSHQLGVPVIEIGNEIFVGFNKKEISKSLDL